MCIAAKPQRSDKGQRLGKFLLRLAGKAHDQVGGDGGAVEVYAAAVRRSRKYRAVSYFRFIRRNVSSQPDCMDRWKWGHRLGSAAARRQKSSVMVRGSRLPSRRRMSPAAAAHRLQQVDERSRRFSGRGPRRISQCR